MKHFAIFIYRFTRAFINYDADWNNRSAEFSGIQISIAQLIIIAFLSWQFSISAVGENVGMTAIMTLMLAQLGFPMDSLGIIMTANIFLVNISGVIAITVRDCDLYDFSHKVNLTT